MISPQVMSSGHGALHLTGIFKLPLATIALIFALKALASIVSLGTGFRGGLFFASLLLGALGGQLFAVGLDTVWPGLNANPDAYAIIGIGALSVAVIGGPLTMTFIALETTGDLWLTTAVLIAVIVSMQVTREFFGYSFTTWRFHLRGETIRSAADVGWIRDLTVGQMMRSDVRTTPVESPISAFREAFPLGSTNQVIAVDEDGRYAGMVIVAEAHAADLPATASVREILHHADHMLLPQLTAQEAIAAFDRFEAEALVVVDSAERRQVIGLLSEAHALRRYSDASERQRRELLGEAVANLGATLRPGRHRAGAHLKDLRAADNVAESRRVGAGHPHLRAEIRQCVVQSARGGAGSRWATISSSSMSGAKPVISLISPAWASTRRISSAFCSPVEASARRNTLAGMGDGEIGQMRAVEGAAGGGVARAVVFQQGAVAVLDLDGAVIGQQLLHPAVERDLGARKAFVARGGERRRKPRHRLGARGGDRHRDLGGLVLDRIEPMGIAARRLPRAGCASAMTVQARRRGWNAARRPPAPDDRETGAARTPGR